MKNNIPCDLPQCSLCNIAPSTLAKYRKPAKVCAWCNICPLEKNDYMENGNICRRCSAKINNRLIELRAENFHKRELERNNHEITSQTQATL